MLSDDSIELIQRCIASFKEYFPKDNDDRTAAMVLNPVLLNLGLHEDLKMLWKGESGRYTEFVAGAKKLLVSKVEEMIKPAEKESAAGEFVIIVLMIYTCFTNTCSIYYFSHCRSKQRE